MDKNSEVMLKEALDMEHKSLPEFKKYETRLKLEEHFRADEHHWDRRNNEINNGVVEAMAREIEQSEHEKYTDAESEDEPDQVSKRDAPEQAPELPNAPPPPIVYCNADMPLDYITNDLITDGHKENKTEELKKQDKNWMKNSVQIDPTVGHEQVNTENDMRVVSIKMENNKIKVEIGQAKADDTVVPVNIERKHEFPSHFAMVNLQEDAKNDSESEKLNAIKKKSPSPVLLKSNAILFNFDGNGNTENFSQPEYVAKEITPDEVKNSNVKSVINMIHVLNIPKANVIHMESKDVVNIEKGNGSNEIKDMFNHAINYSANRHVEISPPKHEQEVVSREMISVFKNMDRELSPPWNEVIEIEKVVIKKPKEPIPAEPQIVIETFPNLQAQLGQVPDTPTRNTSNTAGEPKENIVKINSDTYEQIESESVSHAVVPPLTLEKIKDSDIDTISSQDADTDTTSSQEEYSKGRLKIDSDTDEQIESDSVLHAVEPPLNLATIKDVDIDTTSSQEEHSKGRISPQTNKTTIDVTKHGDIEKPQFVLTMPVKSLSQIKALSFSPKSLPQSSTRPMQYTSLASTIGTKSLIAPINKSDIGPPKSDYPIKRMESVPFEVSILKGILGIGIKTSMTPRGYVQVTEILPNSPVGREGNIKVGDYILSINGTELTGQTDGKVQQILRLLPRGLSKIVVSIVPPETSPDKVPMVGDIEKAQLKTHQSLSLSSRLAPKQSVLSQRLPAASTTTSHMTESPMPSPFKDKPSSLENIESLKSTSKSLLQSPKSPEQASPTSCLSPPISYKLLSYSSVLSASSHFESEMAQIPKEEQNFNLDTIALKLHSPRQPGSQQNIHRMPPPVASKPTKVNEKLAESHTDDHNSSIENEIFASINASDIDSKLAGEGNILPGSVTYDTVSSKENTNCTPGMVSLADIKTIDAKGKTDVYAQEEPNEVHTFDIKDSSKIVLSDTEDYNDKSMTVDNDTFCLEAIESVNKLDVVYSQTNDSLSENKPHTLSTNSTSINECDAEDIIPEHIKEETELKQMENLQSDFQEANVDIVKARSEDVEGELDTVIQSMSSLDIDSLQDIAKTIVAHVMESIKGMDFSCHELDDILPPLLEEIPPPLTECPSPLPTFEEPTFNPVPADVFDLALYPDIDQNEVKSHEQLSKAKHDENEIIEVITKSVDVTLHTTTPFVDTNGSKNDFQIEEASLIQSTEESASQGDDKNIDDSEAGHQSINNVISLYSNVEQSLESDNFGTKHLSLTNNIDELKGSHDDTTNTVTQNEHENCDTKSLSSREDFESDPDIAEKFASDSGIAEKVVSDSDITEVLSVPDIAEKVVGDSDIAEKVVGNCDIAAKFVGNSDKTEKVTVGDNRSGEFSDIKIGLTLNVTMNKGVTGLGFVIQGGKFSPIGDQPISIKRIFKGGPAEGLLQEMDEIMEVNDQDMSNMRQNEAWNHMKYLPSGNVVMKIRRHSTQEPDVEDL